MNEFADVRLAHSVELVSGRGRSLRRRRRAVPALAALVVAAAAGTTVGRARRVAAAGRAARRQRWPALGAGGLERRLWRRRSGVAHRSGFQRPGSIDGDLLKAGVRARVQLFLQNIPTGFMVARRLVSQDARDRRCDRRSRSWATIG